MSMHDQGDPAMAVPDLACLPGVAGSPFSTGQVLPPALGPSVKTLRSLASLIDRDLPADSAGKLRDPRVSPAAWAPVLAREFAMTLDWGARRALARARAWPAPAAAWDGRGRVLVLLPAHGLAAHALRRALPFALCDVPTQVVGHEADRGRIAEILAEIRTLTGLPAQCLELCAEPAPRAVRQLTPDDLAVVTGSCQTAEVVRRHSRAQILGATGSCTVLTGSDPRQLQRTAARLREHDSPRSCTRLHAWWTVRGQTGPASRPNAPMPLAQVHPSAVYRLGAPMNVPVGVEDGYAVLPCDDSGAVGTLTGFARDPRYGWRGDFLL